MNYIQTSVRRNTSPEKIIRDSRGTLIEPGLRVAYNYSGDIAIGNIKEVKKNKWKPSCSMGMYWILDFEMLVENENGPISKIKNPNSFVII